MWFFTSSWWQYLGENSFSSKSRAVFIIHPSGEAVSSLVTSHTLFGIKYLWWLSADGCFSAFCHYLTFVWPDSPLSLRFTSSSSVFPLARRGPNTCSVRRRFPCSVQSRCSWNVGDNRDSPRRPQIINNLIMREVK